MGCSFIFLSIKYLEINEALTWRPVCILMSHKKEMLGFSLAEKGDTGVLPCFYPCWGSPLLLPLLNKGLPGFHYQLSSTGVDLVVDRVKKHGHTGCHSEALKVLTSSSYRCLIYTQYKSVYCDWPHPICWCYKALMIPNKGGRLLTAHSSWTGDRVREWGREGGGRQMMSSTIKYHNGKPPSALHASELWAPSLEATHNLQITTLQRWKVLVQHIPLPESSRSQMICPRSPLLISGSGLLNPHSGLLIPAASPLPLEQGTMRVIVNFSQNFPALSRLVMSILAVHPTQDICCKFLCWNNQFWS